MTAPERRGLSGRRKLILACSIIAAPFFLFALVVLIRETVGAAFFPKTITDVSRYAEFLGDWKKAGLAKHFPDAVPDKATHVRFSFHPKFLQGGAHLQLRVQLPPAEVKGILAQYATKATHRFQGGDTNDHANVEDGVSTTFFFTSGNDDHRFPDSFLILVLDAEPYSKGDFKWNHGHSVGIAVDQGASEVVYWAEQW